MSNDVMFTNSVRKEMICIIFFFFFQLSSEVSGRDAKTKVRGRLKDREEEERMKKEKADTVRKEVEAKYAKWNRG